jgi:hypothetical protein
LAQAAAWLGCASMSVPSATMTASTGVRNLAKALCSVFHFGLPFGFDECEIIPSLADVK